MQHVDGIAFDTPNGTSIFRRNAVTNVLEFSNDNGTTWTTVSSGGALPAAPDFTEAQNAATLLAPGAAGLATWFHNAAARGINGVTTTVSGAAPVAIVPGVLRLATSGTTGQFYLLLAYDQAVGAFLRGGADWYVSGRFSSPGAIDSGTRICIGSLRAAHCIAGVNGALSTSFFSLLGAAGGNIITTIPIDAAQHTHRIWRKGAVTNYQIDGGQIFTGTSDIVTAATPEVNLTDGGAGGVRTIDLMWVFAAVPAL